MHRAAPGPRSLCRLPGIVPRDFHPVIPGSVAVPLHTQPVGVTSRVFVGVGVICCQHCYVPVNTRAELRRLVRVPLGYT